MAAPHVLLLTLLLDGGTPPASSGTAARDGGSVVSPPVVTNADGGTAARAPLVAEGIEWPDELRPLATLDGPAVLAAHAALQRLLAGFPKEYAKDCSYTAKAMEVSVAQHGGLYFVEIKRNVAKCGWAAPGFNPSAHWYELYAVSADGKVLARYPYHP
ncbi:hypothetical protein [Corallococcus exiguus]|uniref:hypothetical protein n=1 Tax=Corallococcus exiguus TaxID=83462 RepID=UPI0020A6C070|nr:hypothetical protein [Corallococcus exiguus]